ncbi:hypothetical protein PGO_072930 [Plasmodium gonderi]|uniref:Uncharacterized protein n=1 Tax=Plasmodium gonderi TaxID=77519 RepID=A0A1Y1JFE8_PLAGO|nr:hypothetical protein PGO_072930 [Plasmodium gonderi]GAW80378.1 hypothetical protein PGO_072930 [Plasmodium gonderi]
MKLTCTLLFLLAVANNLESYFFTFCFVENSSVPQQTYRVPYLLKLSELIRGSSNDDLSYRKVEDKINLRRKRENENTGDGIYYSTENRQEDTQDNNNYEQLQENKESLLSDSYGMSAQEEYEQLSSEMQNLVDEVHDNKAAPLEGNEQQDVGEEKSNEEKSTDEVNSMNEEKSRDDVQPDADTIPNKNECISCGEEEKKENQSNIFPESAEDIYNVYKNQVGENNKDDIENIHNKNEEYVNNYPIDETNVSVGGVNKFINLNVKEGVNKCISLNVNNGNDPNGNGPLNFYVNISVVPNISDELIKDVFFIVNKLKQMFEITDTEENAE